MAAARGLVEDMGERALRLIADLGGMSLLAAQTFYQAMTPPYSPRLLIAQMDHIAVRSIDLRLKEEVRREPLRADRRHAYRAPPD